MRNIRNTHGIYESVMRDVSKIVKRKLNESDDEEDDDYSESEDEEDDEYEESNLPNLKLTSKEKFMLSQISKVLEVDIPTEEDEFEVIQMRNRGGYVYEIGYGFTYSYCTSSMEDGPEIDISDELKFYLKAIGFEIVNSYGDNGMDPYGSYGQDTYWNYDFVLNRTRKYV